MRTFSYAVFFLASAVAHAQLTPIAGITDIQAGTRHACAIDGNGGLRCWGDNFDGQLGNGNTDFTGIPVDVTGLSSGVVAVSPGGRHTCALLGSGDVACWGFNGNGQLGDGSNTNSTVPVTVQSLGTGVTAIASGELHTCALFNTGGVKCWGYNADGQLGNGTTSAANAVNAVPVNVSGLTGATQLASRSLHTCVIEGSFAKCWGFNSYGQLGDGTTTSSPLPVTVLVNAGGAPYGGLQQVAPGLSHTCAKDTNGGAICWGDNRAGTLGDGTTIDRPSPVPVSGLPNGVATLRGGDLMTCALLATGGVKCWGESSYGQIGDGHMAGSSTNAATVARLVPTTAAIAGVNQIAVGGAFACARNGGAVKCWGDNRFGELGDDRVPVFDRVTPQLGVVGLQGGTAQVSTRGSHACARTGTGNVRCWGANHYGDVGDGTLGVRTVSTAVPGVSAVTQIAAGTLFTCALNSDTNVHCWGFNDLGALGNGNFTSSANAGGVLDSAGSLLLGGVTAISSGGSHACALRNDTGVQCWGNRGFGRLGDGLATPPSALPVDVLASVGGPPLLGFAEVSAGQNHVCARTTTGGVKCWGRGSNGRLGDGQTGNRLIPVDVLDSSGLAPLAGIAAVRTGLNHTCALTTTGTVKCWGLNDTGQLGDGTQIDRLLPVDVAGLPPNVDELSAGGHTCARNGGLVRCWGPNFFGQLGDGSVQFRLLPVQVLGLSDATQISAGYDATCAVRGNGATVCWGSDQQGQLGFGNRNFAIPGDVRVFEAPRMVAPVTPAADDASLAPQSDAAGRYIVFQSSATNLLGAGGDANGGSDVYVVDRETGDAVRASVNDNGSEGGGGAIEPAVTANGMAVTFVAPDAAIMRVMGESKAAARARTKQVTSALFLRNLITGTTQRLGLALPAATGTKPRVAAGGKAIVYTAVNFDPGQGAVGQQNVYRIPLDQVGDTLVPQATECVSCQSRSLMGAAAGAVDGESGNAVVSADGRYVVYETKSGNAVVGQPSPCPNTQVMLRDMILGFSQRISPPAGVSGLNCGTSGSTSPSIDWPGNNVVFVSDSVLKPGTLPGTKAIFAGGINAVNFERLSETEGGDNPDGTSDQPVFSGDGDTVVYVSDATNLDGSYVDTNAVADVYAQARGPSGTLTGGRRARLSRTTTGAEANAPANRPALNYNATLMVFDSAASNLVGGDANGANDVFQRSVSLNAAFVFGAGFE